MSKLNGSNIFLSKWKNLNQLYINELCLEVNKVKRIELKLRDITILIFDRSLIDKLLYYIE